MKSFRVVVLCCMLVLALGAFAHQGSMQQPAQTPQAPGAANQAQQPGAMPPSTAPQTQPGTVSPQAQTPQSEPSQAPPAMRSSGVDAQVNSLAQSLNLTSDQQEKVKTILEAQHEQGVTVINDSSLSSDAKMQKIHALRQSTIDKVRCTLTSDQQKTKFDAMVQAQNNRIREREQQQQQQQPQQQQPNNTPPPK